MALHCLKPVEVVNSGPIGISTYMYIDIQVGPSENLRTQCSRMSVTSLIEEYILFTRLVSDEGIELPTVGYLRLFQIIIEIIITMWGDMDDNYTTPSDDNVVLYNVMFRESLISELTHETHKPMLSELSCDDDTVMDLLRIVEQINLTNIVQVNRLQDTILVPYRWSCGGNVVLLHTLDYQL